MQMLMHIRKIHSIQSGQLTFIRKMRGWDIIYFPGNADTMDSYTKHACHLENEIQRATEREDESLT